MIIQFKRQFGKSAMSEQIMDFHRAGFKRLAREMDRRYISNLPYRGCIFNSAVREAIRSQLDLPDRQAVASLGLS